MSFQFLIQNLVINRNFRDHLEDQPKDQIHLLKLRCRSVMELGRLKPWALFRANVAILLGDHVSVSRSLRLSGYCSFEDGHCLEV